jgi:uncharacterized RDD family membrane protein YckC
MKCPKCGYQSFNNLTACKKCGRDLSQERQKLNFGNPVVMPVPVPTPEEPIPAATEVPAAPTPASVVVQESAPQEDEYELECFFESIDSLNQEPTPSATSPARQAPTDFKARSTAKPQASAELPQSNQKSPQGDFLFDEIDSDHDALRLSRTTEPVAEGASPFDDVDTFGINWQLPMDEAEITETAPEAREAAREAEAAPPPVIPAIEQQTAAEESPLPERDLDQQLGKDFTLEDSCGAEPSAATSAALSFEVQEELPLTAGKSRMPTELANIAAVFRPDAGQDPLALGARLLTRRAQAYLADLGLLIGIFALFVCAGEIARSPAAEQRFRFSSDVLLDLATPYFLVFFSLCFGYFTLFHYLSGQTPGKMLFAIRVEADEHADITLAQAFLRCVGGLIALLPAGLGFLSIVLDEEQRGWNDQLAGCRVVMLEELAGD